MPRSRTTSAWGRDRKVLARGKGWSALLWTWAPAGCTIVQVTATSVQKAGKRLARIVASVPPAAAQTGHTAVTLLQKGDPFPIRSVRTIRAPGWDDVASNYPPPIARALGGLIDRQEPPNGRIVVLHGKPGTGKTTFLRTLARAWSSWADVTYILDPDTFLSDPAYMLAAVSDADEDEVGTDPRRIRLLILEDLGTTIGDNVFRLDSIVKLLNVTDGMMGEELDFRLVVTTNLAESSIAPALLRPGRCLARLELRPFDPLEADQWLGARGAAKEPMTIAELLERRGDLEQIAASGRGPGPTGQYL